MIRISQLRLPLDHTDAELRAAVRVRLGLEPDAPLELTLFKRSYDVRKKHAPMFVYTVDVTVDVDTPNAAAIRSSLTDDPEISATPDMAYRFVKSTEEVSGHMARAGALRPVVIGMGPCGLFAALVLAQMGLRPLVLERGLGGSNYHAPVQRVGDFLRKRASSGLGEVIPSYTPGVTPTALDASLPDWAIAAIREAIPAFDRTLRGFAMHDAVLTGVETRTSSPIRVPRDGDSVQSVNTPGLFPAGEGAGFAGGILSSAIDGIHVAEAVARDLLG